jgi:hypothetical protein
MTEDHRPAPVGRRQAGLLAAAALAGCAAPSHAGAQGQPRGSAPAPRFAGPTGVVPPLPMPCADRPGDLTGFLLEGFGSPAGTVAVLGQAFRPGDLPREARLAARTAEGRAVPAQLDVAVRHPDGSARFGVLSLALPALPRGQRLGVVLSRAAAAPPAPPLDLAAALARRQAVVTVTPAGGGTPWRVDLLALLRDAPAEERPWQSGPLAVQRRVTAAPVAFDARQGPSLRLVADIAARADGTLWVDLWLRNDIAMREGGGPVAYSARLLLDGREVLRSEEMRQFQYQGWGRLIGVAAGGHPPPPQPLPRPDAAYLAETGAVARYDLSTGVEEGLLTGLARTMADAAWDVPLGPRGITQDMPMAGGRADLGATTLYQAAWLASGDPRAALFCIGQAEAAGAVTWHFWDPRGGWMDNRRWPGFWFDGRNGPPPRSLLQPVAHHSEAGWNPEAAHQPALSFIPYLLTGRRAFLDELQAQAAWNVLSVWPGTRDVAGAAKGVNLIHERQVRSAAWAMRQLDEASWISPDDDPQQAYFRDVSARNWAWLRERIPELTAWQGEAHGWVVNTEFRREITPFQQDYFATTAAAAARRGSEDARAVLAWMANFLAGRFLAEAKGFPRNDGAAFTVTMAAGDGKPFRTWGEIAAAMRAANWSNGTGWARSEGEYGRLALQTLAILQDVLGHEGARRAYLSLLGSSPPPYTTPQDFARVPTHNIVPRGMPRVPGRAPRCAAAERG